MRAIGSPVPDHLHLLTSLCELAVLHPLPFVVAAVGTHPIRWHALAANPAPNQRWRAPDDTYAIGIVGGGTTQSGEDVTLAFVIDHTGQHRTVIRRDAGFIDTAEAMGDLIDDCRDALGLNPAA